MYLNAEYAKFLHLSCLVKPKTFSSRHIRILFLISRVEENITTIRKKHIAHGIRKIYQ